MLETERIRYFFTASPETIHKIVDKFSQNEGGNSEPGSRNIHIYRFSDSTGGRRFLTVSIRITSEQSSGTSGNITLRWRDEPKGPYVEKAKQLIDEVEETHELLSLAEARQRED